MSLARQAAARRRERDRGYEPTRARRPPPSRNRRAACPVAARALPNGVDAEPGRDPLGDASSATDVRQLTSSRSPETTATRSLLRLRQHQRPHDLVTARPRCSRRTRRRRVADVDERAACVPRRSRRPAQAYGLLAGEALPARQHDAAIVRRPVPCRSRRARCAPRRSASSPSRGRDRGRRRPACWTVGDRRLDERERLHRRMRLGLRRSRDLPDVALVAVAAPVVLGALAPAEPDRLVLPLVVGAAQDEAVLLPDDRVATSGRRPRRARG